MKYEVIDQVIGETLRARREKLGLSTREMAQRLGVGKSTYSYYEIAHTSMPIHKFKMACDILGLDHIEVFEHAQEVMLEELKKGIVE